MAITHFVGRDFEQAGQKARGLKKIAVGLVEVQ